MNKWIKYPLLAALIVLAAYNSLYIRKLSDVKQAANASAFDAAAYAGHFLHTTLPANSGKAIDLSLLSRTLTTDPTKAFSWSHAQNDGNNRFFLVGGQGKIIRLDPEYVYLEVEGTTRQVLLATRYIIGTAARDGSGLISVDAFTTTMQMNDVSEELNKLIRTEVTPPFRAAAKPGAHVDFIAGLELQRNSPIPDSLELTPLILNIENAGR